MGTGASDQELLQFVEKAGVRQFAGKVEHWLDKKGPLDDPGHEQGRLALLDIARMVPKAMADGGASLPGKIPAVLLDKIMASPPLADPKKEEQRQKFLQQLREHGSVPMPPMSCKFLVISSHRPLPAARVSDSARTGISPDRNLRGESEARVMPMTAT